MLSSRNIFRVIALACFASLGLTEKPIKSEITGYGFASSSNTLYTGAQGSEHSLDAYPIGTLIYVVGLQKYFSVQDSCGDCTSQSQPHFDLWMGAPSYSDLKQLQKCAGGITVTDPTAAVIINPNNGYVVDTTPLMSSTGTCDNDADYSRTQPVLASGGTTGGDSTGRSGSCSWEGHCQGAPCQTDDDCSDPFSCVNHLCT
ncbi:hypothetical protein HO173_012627 [Letharia columbiana]|uniref:Uncharacterized protein n=1 Tax=Letharia columbiana TaxID=112416 RepID=A0A8H6FEY1_9LECA|nr:uncharacterized protein HO173_012627 [Letharia columbiana]KAF6225997.1 hypothetical protein HO173_012627 [Letharia columbiana]